MRNKDVSVHAGTYHAGMLQYSHWWVSNNLSSSTQKYRERPWVPTSFPWNYYRWFLHDDKVAATKSLHLLPASTAIKSRWSYTSIELYVFIMWCFITFTLHISRNVNKTQTHLSFIQHFLCCTRACSHPTRFCSDEQNSACLSLIAVLLCRYPVADASSTTACYFAVYY